MRTLLFRLLTEFRGRRFTCWSLLGVNYRRRLQRHCQAPHLCFFEGMSESLPPSAALADHPGAGTYHCGQRHFSLMCTSAIWLCCIGSDTCAHHENTTSPKDGQKGETCLHFGCSFAVAYFAVFSLAFLFFLLFFFLPFCTFQPPISRVPLGIELEREKILQFLCFILMIFFLLHFWKFVPLWFIWEPERHFSPLPFLKIMCESDYLFFLVPLDPWKCKRWNFSSNYWDLPPGLIFGYGSKGSGL